MAATAGSAGSYGEEHAAAAWARCVSAPHLGGITRLFPPHGSPVASVPVTGLCKRFPHGTQGATPAGPREDRRVFAAALTLSTCSCVLSFWKLGTCVKRGGSTARPGPAPPKDALCLGFVVLKPTPNSRPRQLAPLGAPRGSLMPRANLPRLPGGCLRAPGAVGRGRGPSAGAAPVTRSQLSGQPALFPTPQAAPRNPRARPPRVGGELRGPVCGSKMREAA